MVTQVNAHAELNTYVSPHKAIKCVQPKYVAAPWLALHSSSSVKPTIATAAVGANALYARHHNHNQATKTKKNRKKTSKRASGAAVAWRIFKDEAAFLLERRRGVE